MKLGFTFSIKYCEELGLDWREALLRILRFTNWEYVRLPVYWDRVEATEGVLDFSMIHEQIGMIREHDIKIIPVVGYRNPRFPEVHRPDWLKELSKKEFSDRLFEYVKSVHEELASYQSIFAWQIENEPFEYGYGMKEFDVRDTYQEEVSILRKLEDRPIVVTYGYKPWRKTFPEELQEDIVGLDVYSKIGVKVLGQPWYPDMFRVPFMSKRLKREINFIRKLGKSVWVTELQAEPWDVIDDALFDSLQWKKTITPNRLRRNLEFISSSEIDTAFIWGVEWWLTLQESDREAFTRVLNRK